jgi:hypothetical protein
LQKIIIGGLKKLGRKHLFDPLPTPPFSLNLIQTKEKIAKKIASLIFVFIYFDFRSVSFWPLSGWRSLLCVFSPLISDSISNRTVRLFFGQPGSIIDLGYSVIRWCSPCLPVSTSLFVASARLFAEDVDQLLLDGVHFGFGQIQMFAESKE